MINHMDEIGPKSPNFSAKKLENKDPGNGGSYNTFPPNIFLAFRV
jgi:hypothetical protein